jgi:uncharacterized Tic20 family protein/DNA-binding Xre family transcriptional regulator
MNQPDLGLKVSELRQKKNMTQEQLAERCEISARTIQRIEGGEVDPRSYTLSCLGEVLEFDFGVDNESSENVWLAALHLSTIFCILLFIPLLIWSWKKPHSYKIDKQGREVLNFQITMTLLLFTALVMLMFLPLLFIILGNSGIDLGLHMGLLEVMIVCVPMPLIPIGIFCIYQGVINAMRALTDRPIHYPLAIPFVK